MTHNPEFQRQLWLNWRPAQLGWSLLLTALLLATPMVLVQPNDRLHALLVAALIGMWIAAAGLGSVLAGRGLNEEAHQHTWDWQRLSALSPWQMAWGKLIGAALPAWLYALWFAIAIAGIATVWVLEQLSVVHMVGLAVVWGLGLQTWAMNSVLMSWGQHDSPVNRRRAALLPLLLLFFIPGPFLGRVYDNIFNSNDEAVLWWGLDVGGLGIAYLAGALVLALGLLGLWRMLCARLDVRTLPWAWPLGIVVTGIFAGGTFNGGLNAFLGCTAWVALLGTVYVALQHIDQHLRAWRQVQWSISRGRLREALEALPLWPVSLLLGLIASLLVALRPSPLEAEIASALGSLSVLMYLQLLRDCLLLTGFALLVGKLKSPMVSFVIAWLILNVAAPLLAYGVAGMKGAMFIQPVLAQWVGGLDSTEQVWVGFVPWISLGVQILAVLAWVIYVFQERVLGFARSNAAARI